MPQSPKLILLFRPAVCFLFTACSLLPSDDRKPVVIYSQTMQVPENAASQTEIDVCMEIADRLVLKPQKLKVTANRSFLTSLAGATTGAVSGAIVGDTAESIAAGASVGAIVGLLQAGLELSQHSPDFQRFVERCLQQRGYDVVGWEAYD